MDPTLSEHGPVSLSTLTKPARFRTMVHPAIGPVSGEVILLQQALIAATRQYVSAVARPESSIHLDMHKVTVTPARNGMYRLTVRSDNSAAADSGASPQSYSAEELPSVLLALGVDRAKAERAAIEAEQIGHWTIDISE